MRPVDKGKNSRSYSDYRDAFSDLSVRLGDYCSYCERQIKAQLAVEHIQPRCHHPTLKNTWSNFLLACANCNSTKGRRDVALEDFFWPDRDNTLRAIQYSEGGVVTPNKNLNSGDHARAKDTILLTGLDKSPGIPGRTPTKNDSRWKDRRECWLKAKKYSERLENSDDLVMRECIVDLAVASGMFSIWWTVFDGDSDMRRRLREAFVGTDASCFDAGENLIQRNGGRI